MFPLVLILFGFGAWFIWKKYKNEVLGHPSYALDPNNIQFTAPPEWIKANILEDVIKFGSLEKMKLNEPGLSFRIATAFEHHPWVKRVERAIPTYPGKFDVKLTYREPIAMVALPDDDPTDDEAWILPIDAESVLLPSDDFTPQFAQAFPRIDVGNTSPSSDLPGTGWGDDAVADAAKIAEVLFAEWDVLGNVIYQIELSSQPFSMSNHADFDIRGRPDLGEDPPGLIIRWGRAPGKEHPQEPTAKAKLQKLKQWVQDVKASDLRPIGEIDLRSIRALQASKMKTIVR